eukprot:tig00021122_g18444.t1
MLRRSAGLARGAMPMRLAKEAEGTAVRRSAKEGPKRDWKTEVWLKFYQFPQDPLPKRSPEELAANMALAKRYSREMLLEHNRQMGAMNRMLRCKQSAIRALPSDLRKAAMVQDSTLFPLYRHTATWTPPDPNYVPPDENEKRPKKK